MKKKLLKLKDLFTDYKLLNEAYVWERKFGEKLPTLDDVQKKYEKKKKKKNEGFTSGTPLDKENTKTRSNQLGYKMVGEEEKPTFDLSKESDRGDSEFPSGNLKEWTDTDIGPKRWSKKYGDKYTDYEKEQLGLKEESIDLNEDNWDKINIPANVKRWMGRFIDSVNSVKLEKIKKMAILFHVIKALGLNPQELNVYVQRIRRGLK
tara:strand:- start:185 stop:802 length:618 start_codon:yes stop_codon:yes gene_type:complete